MRRKLIWTFGIISFVFIIVLVGWISIAQESAEEAAEEPKSLLLEPTCPENCGFATHTYLASKMYAVEVKSDSKICNNIDKQGMLEESEIFVSDKCQILCGYPAEEAQWGSPNIKNCIKCVPLKQTSKPFDDGSTHCWDKPGANKARREYCLEKGQSCFEECKKNSQVHIGTIPSGE